MGDILKNFFLCLDKINPIKIHTEEVNPVSVNDKADK